MSSREASWAAKVILSEIAFGSCVVFSKQPASTSKVHRGSKRRLPFGPTALRRALFLRVNPDDECLLGSYDELTQGL
jgi:hypothetical protein